MFYLINNFDYIILLTLKQQTSTVTMQSSQSREGTFVPLLCISSIKKSRNWTLAQTERYDREHRSPFLQQSHTSALIVKHKIKKPSRKVSESSVVCLKINNTFDFIASNLISCRSQPKNKRNLSLMLQKLPQNKQKAEKVEDRIRKISEKREQKAKLLTQLITNYKLQKSNQKTNDKQQNCYFATEVCETQRQKKCLTARQHKHQSLQSKNQSINPKSKREQPNNSFPCDPDLKMLVSHELSKLWKLKSKTNAKINQFNLVNYYQRSNYQNRIKNIKITLKK